MTDPILAEVNAAGTGLCRLTAADRKRLRELAGKPIVITERERIRSLDQNAYLHAEPFPKLAEYMGEDIEGAKLVLMGECWGWKRDGFSGKEIPVKPRTSSMTVEECSYFIEWIGPWAFQHCDGLRIFLPDEWEARGRPRYLG